MAFLQPCVSPMISTETKTKAKCRHCGDACLDETIHFDGHAFCCEGCRTVYQFLSGSGLQTYYQLAENPGVKVTEKHGVEAALDDPEIQRKLLDFAETNLHMVTFQVPAIHCSACVWLLEKLPSIAPGITQSRVNFTRREVTISYLPGEQTLSGVVEWLSKIGYKPVIENRQNQLKRPKRNPVLLKLGVAAFCFGNIMLFSFPEYLGMDEASLRQFKPVFGYLNLLLALPVFFYSGWGYFRSAWQSLKVGHVSIDVPIALGILVLFLRSAFEVVSGMGAGYFDSLAGLTFFMLTGKWFQNHTYDALNFERDYRSYFPMAVARHKGSEIENTAIEKIEVGDRIRILNNQVIPADSVLISGRSLTDYSFVNGESNPVKKKPGDLIFAGGRHNGAPIELEVVKAVDQGYLTRLWNQQAFSGKEARHRFSSLLNAISKYFTLAILLIAIGSFAYWAPKDMATSWNAFTAVLIIACPCALALSMPFTFGNVTRLLGRNGFYVRDSAVLEKLATADTIVFDKTGTLTTPKREVEYFGPVLTADDRIHLKSTAMCSTHPLSVALAGHLSGPINEPLEVAELGGRGVKAFFDGCSVKIGSANFLGLHDFSPAGEGETHVFVRVNGTTGCFVFRTALRPGTQEMVDAFQKDGYEMHLLSGDNSASADEVRNLFGDSAVMHFHQSPEDKLHYIESLQTAGKKVAFVGDGLNDAGALKAASVGIAVADDVHGFSPSSDIIASAKSLPKLRKIVRFCSQSLGIVKMAVFFSLLYNVVGLSMAVQGLLTPVFAAVFMPMSSITIVSFVTLATRWLYLNTKE